MNYLDTILLIFMLLGLFRGLKNGFLVELASLVGVIAGVYGAIHFSYYAANLLTTWVDWDERNISLVAFITTFIIIVLSISLLARALTQFANLVMLGLVNKLLGALFGLLKSVFILSLILILLSAFSNAKFIIDEEVMERSQLYPYVARVAPSVLPNILREIENYDTYL